MASTHPNGVIRAVPVSVSTTDPPAAPGRQTIISRFQVAYICGSRYAGTYVVTLSVDRVDFIAPIQGGELVTFQASVNYTGRTSLEVGIRVLSENLHEHSVRHTNSSYFTMVAIGDNNKPTPVPEFKPSDTIERRRFQEAHQRRNDRMRRARIRRDRRERNPLDLLPA